MTTPNRSGPGRSSLFNDVPSDLADEPNTIRSDIFFWLCLTLKWGEGGEEGYHTLPGLIGRNGRDIAQCPILFLWARISRSINLRSSHDKPESLLSLAMLS